MEVNSENVAHVGVTLCILISTVWSFLSARRSKVAASQATQANDAVNHRHINQTPRLYDVVLKTDKQVDELVNWKRTYDGGPLDSGQKVIDFMDTFLELRSHVREHDDKIEDIVDELNPDD
jgi:hypothetical protein